MQVLSTLQELAFQWIMKIISSHFCYSSKVDTWNIVLTQHKIQGQVTPNFWDCLRCSSPLLYPWATPYRGTELAIWGLVLRTRECASRNSLVTGRPAIAGNRTQVCCMGGENITITPPSHLMLVTTKFEISMPISWDKSVALEPQLLPIECVKF